MNNCCKDVLSMKIWSLYCKICCDIRNDVLTKLITADPTVKKLGNNFPSWWKSSQGVITCTGQKKDYQSIIIACFLYFEGINYRSSKCYWYYNPRPTSTCLHYCGRVCRPIIVQHFSLVRRKTPPLVRCLYTFPPQFPIVFACFVYSR